MNVRQLPTVHSPIIGALRSGDKVRCFPSSAWRQDGCTWLNRAEGGWFAREVAAIRP